MKRVQQSTYLLIKAYTDSEWDNCDFAIVHITDEWKQIMRARLAKAQAFKNGPGFYYLIYSGGPENFYKDDDVFSADQVLHSEEESCFVILEQTNLDNLSRPNSRLHLYQMMIDADGIIRYNASGKHTGTEYYTAEFSLHDILNSII
ncbi:MAG TPA: hypothetical protein VG738_18645 [Chitinophagaceae bacterium]|nr:hypothetical protein [Chitinophagaceae bacterium]